MAQPSKVEAINQRLATVAAGGHDGDPTASTTSRFELVNPVSYVRYRMARKKFEEDSRLLKKDEQMKQNVERFLMECEERHSWVAHELNVRNYTRIRRVEEVAKIKRAEEVKNTKELEEQQKENGLCYSRGLIISNRKWQNGPAKHLDLSGHTGPIMCCKLSQCQQYVISCSMDHTAKVWLLRTGKCVLTFHGHRNKVTGCDIHPTFRMESKMPVLVTCSGDRTLKLWGTTIESSLKTLYGHAEAIYACSFSPDGQRIASCSEDLTVRTWCFPDGFMLYTYRGHTSPVITVSFSPSGRYIVSASDYGERKILMWDTRMPLIEQPIQ
jgi:WD40 repeat protein